MCVCLYLCVCMCLRLCVVSAHEEKDRFLIENREESSRKFRRPSVYLRDPSQIPTYQVIQIPLCLRGTDQACKEARKSQPGSFSPKLHSH